MRTALLFATLMEPVKLQVAASHLFLALGGTFPGLGVERFDAGIGPFLIALCLAALLHVSNPVPRRLIAPYSLFGALALGMSREEGSRRGGLSRRSGWIILAPVALVACLAAVGALSLLPALFGTAERTADAMGKLFGAFGSRLVAFPKWLSRIMRARRPGPAALPS